MNEDAPLEGGCACGAVRYRLTAKPMFVHCCHCHWCQREAGSAFVINALIEAHEVELTADTPEIVMTPSNSGQGQKIHRCQKCHVAVWSNYAMSVGEKLRFVRVGTLDDPSAIPPDVHIFTSSKLPWITLSDGIPVFEEYYDRREQWPAQSLARLKVLRSL